MEDDSDNLSSTMMERLSDFDEQQMLQVFKQMLPEQSERANTVTVTVITVLVHRQYRHHQERYEVQEQPDTLQDLADHQLLQIL